MCLLLSLSKYIVIPLLTEWLTGKDFVRFDGCLTNHTERFHFSSLVEKHRKPFQACFFSALRLNQSLHMLRFAKTRGYNLEDYRLLINPVTLASFKSEVAANGLTLKKKFEYVTNITKMEIAVTDNTEAAMISRLLQCFKQIESLHTTGCNIFGKVGQYCQYLTQLEVGNRVCKSMRLGLVFRHCKRLTQLTWLYDIKYCEVYCAMIVHSQSLQCVKLTTSCNRLGMALLAVHGPRRMLNSLTINCPGDKTLNSFLWYHGARLSTLCLYNNGEAITTAGVKGIGAACPLLCDFTPPARRMSIEAQCELLTSLKLKRYVMYGTEQLTPNIVAALAGAFRQEELYVHSCWFRHIESVTFQWDNLRILSLCSSEFVAPVIRQCPNLRDFTLTYLYGECTDYEQVLVSLLYDLSRIHIMELDLPLRLTLSFKTIQKILDTCVSLTNLYCGHNYRKVRYYVCGGLVVENYRKSLVH